MRIHGLKQSYRTAKQSINHHGQFSLAEGLPQNINTELGRLEDAFTPLNVEPPNVRAALDELTRD